MDDLAKQQEILVSMVKVVKAQENMDEDTIIYRIAMTIYHSKALAKQALIPSLDDAGAVYLKAQQNPRLQKLVMEMTERYKAVSPVELVKTFMCFVVAAYIVQQAE